MSPKLVCSNPMCSERIDFAKGFKQVGTRLFHTLDCALAWQQANQIIQFAAEGKPTISRRPERGKKWFE